MLDKVFMMDDKYRKQHYPNGFFAALAKDGKGVGAILIVCGIVLALIGAFVLLLLGALAFTGAFEIPENLDVIILFAVLGLVFLIPGGLLAGFGAKRCASGESYWISACAKSSDYPESIVRDFANQVMENGTLQLVLGTSRIQGILTRDYIFLKSFLNPCVIKIEDIAGAYLVRTRSEITVNGVRQIRYDNNIKIISNHKTTIGSDAGEQTVLQLLNILTQKNPAIDTEGCKPLSESEYNAKKAAFGIEVK